MRISQEHGRALAQGVAAFSLEVVTIIVLYRHNLVLLVVLCLETLVALRVWATRDDRVAFLLTGLVGSLAEAVFVRAGVWQYANPSLLGLPIWFPVSFGLAGAIALRLVRSVLAF
jgi:uncharacterized membrane protein YoaT (DUF817 family)